MPASRESLEERYKRMDLIEEDLHRKGYLALAGVDEAGRGPLAGPVVAAACILDPAKPILGLNDSKKLSEKRREALFEQIREEALAYKIKAIPPARIDRINILEATKEAMTLALQELEVKPDFILLDAITLKDFPPEIQMALVKGDARSNTIAAASILAKVSRDRYMKEMDEQYPGYGFSKHKGYGTKAHYEALDTLGPSPIHRKSFLRKWAEERKLR
jgi:ribonuclease HII